MKWGPKAERTLLLLDVFLATVRGLVPMYEFDIRCSSVLRGALFFGVSC